MTEDQAKTKWCPFARAPDTGRDGVVAINRALGIADPDCKCLASACAAWRWEITAPKTGYCGLAGRLT